MWQIQIESQVSRYTSCNMTDYIPMEPLQLVLTDRKLIGLVYASFGAPYHYLKVTRIAWGIYRRLMPSGIVKMALLYETCCVYSVYSCTILLIRGMLARHELSMPESKVSLTNYKELRLAKPALPGAASTAYCE